MQHYENFEELWYGNIHLYERDVVPGSKYAELGKLTARNCEKLIPLLSLEQKAIFDALMDNISELNTLGQKEMFEIGFRIGAKVMLEVLEGTEENVTAEV